MAIKAPYLPYDRLRKRAESFLAKYNPEGDIPVPIEEIIDLHFKLNIVPTPGLHEVCLTDSYISSALSDIYVDEFVYEERPGRYRFSLAHELAHVIIHGSVFSELSPFNSIEGWRSAMDLIPEREYGLIEWQAYSLAGLLLVPTDELKARIVRAIQRLKRAGVDMSEAAIMKITAILADAFNVSSAVIEKRCKYEELLQP